MKNLLNLQVARGLNLKVEAVPKEGPENSVSGDVLHIRVRDHEVHQESVGSIPRTAIAGGGALAETEGAPPVATENGGETATAVSGGVDGGRTAATAENAADVHTALGRGARIQKVTTDGRLSNC